MSTEKDSQDNIQEMLGVIELLGKDRFTDIFTSSTMAIELMKEYKINNSLDRKMDMLISVTILIHCIFEAIESLKEEGGEDKVNDLKSKCKSSLEKLNLI